MNVNEMQQQIFQVIKIKLPAEASMADEVAKLLDISSDSAYRRMRSEKAITFDELFILATHYKISLDQLMNIETGGFLFQGNFQAVFYWLSVPFRRYCLTNRLAT